MGDINRLGVRVPLGLIATVEQPLPAELVDDAEFVELSIHGLTAHAVVFRDLRDAHEALAVEDAVGVVGLRLQLTDELLRLLDLRDGVVVLLALANPCLRPRDGVFDHVAVARSRRRIRLLHLVEALHVLGGEEDAFLPSQLVRHHLAALFGDVVALVALAGGVFVARFDEEITESNFGFSQSLGISGNVAAKVGVLLADHLCHLAAVQRVGSRCQLNHVVSHGWSSLLLCNRFGL